ncbi:hypothetical protein TWF106_011448 [Orbilia oligospora]|uniref:Uncharacterized protein n=1 Tax=Orbilia oligospora TaxID=2813651 RepID=A0A7C8UGC7_ORBOL|nr:hypothetical protein TWF106_011448 [Orbilia oligospora]
MDSKWDLDLAFPDSPTDEYSVGINGNLAYGFLARGQQLGGAACEYQDIPQEILARITEPQLLQRLPYSSRKPPEEEISGGSGELVGCIIINASSKKICLFLENSSDLIDSEAERLSIPKYRQAPGEGIKQAAIRAGEMTGNKCYLLPIGGDVLSAYSGFYIHPNYKGIGAVAAEYSSPIPAGQQVESIRWFIAAIDENRQMVKMREEMKARRHSKVQDLKDIYGCDINSYSTDCQIPIEMPLRQQSMRQD